ncbi:hypothetical protein [Pyxidicoccus caerfyrddinensis]|uniref:hypothetical protein n=1 Tax=Pyxidicoccus caerfyrddinensis TaxID=2709663 RepID=UPI0013D94A73|nr:hypothetical protein [Pyxidicoccus caerfyrddinensis]
MSNRISQQSSPFQPTTLKGPDAPTAPQTALSPARPEPKPPPPTVDEFVQDVARNFERILGQVGALASGVVDPHVKGTDKEPPAGGLINGDGKPEAPVRHS